MPWARFDDRYPSNRKVRPLSDQAFRMDVSAICWCNENLTNGFIPGDELPLVSDLKRPLKVAAELVSRGRWDVVPGGWEIHHFLDYNKSADQVREERAAAAERQRKAREAAKARRDAMRGGDSHAVTTSVTTPVTAPVTHSEVTPDVTVPPSFTRPLPERTTTTTPPGGAKAPPDPPAALALVQDRQPRTPAQLTVEAYVRGAAAAGQPEPAPSLRSRVGKQAAAMAARTPVDVLLTAAEHMGAAGWHDLAVQVQRDAATSRPPPRRSATDDAVAVGLALAAKYAEESA